MLPPTNQEAETAFIQHHANSDEAVLYEIITLALAEQRPQLAAKLIALLPEDSEARALPSFQRVNQVLDWIIQGSDPAQNQTSEATLDWTALANDWALCSAAFTRARLDGMRHRYREHYREQQKHRRPRGPRRAR